MPSRLICPYCGSAQRNTQNIRKVGVAIKNAAKVAGGFLVKEGTKAVVSTVTGFDNKSFNQAVGRVGNGIANEMGLGMKNTESLSSVRYKCSCCGRYWDGFDSASTLNDIQRKTALGLLKKCRRFAEEEFNKSLKNVAISLVMGVISILLWTARSSQDVTKTVMWIDYTTTEYSWHYYFFWPLCIATFISLCLSIPNFIEHMRNKKNFSSVSVEEFYRLYLSGNNIVTQYLN